jgi:Type IV secretory pathway, VirD4 components
MNKLRAFLLRGAIKTILGQAAPKASLEELIESGGLVLVRIPKGLLGEDTSRLLGGLIVARMWQAAMRRVSVEETEREDVALYVDEMHNYLTLPRSFEDLLAEARGYGLSLVLAHQHLGQLTKDMRDALAANARTKIAFACSPEDAAQLEKHFEPALTTHDLGHLPAFVAACRPCVEGSGGRAFTFGTAPLGSGSAMRGSEVRKKSAELFASPRATIEAEINARHVRPEVLLVPTTAGRSSGHSHGQSLGQSIGRPGPTDEGFGKAAGEVA